mmetsp:Transcript_1281/g.3378  ORF Transcript_1281/g.3378 Transcript_1281/m.3378 type:complete len:170 (+) Transcript_1281:202-711(+)
MWSSCVRGAINRTVVGLVHRPSATSMTPSRPAMFTSLSSFRTFSTAYTPSPLDAFRDPVDRETRGSQQVGRSWSVKELRRKSYEDLHKLWYVLYMERNMLLTERQLSRRRQLIFPQPERMKKVRKSMQAIRQVLGERKRSKIAAYNASKMEEAMQEESEMEDVKFSAEK